MNVDPIIQKIIALYYKLPQFPLMDSLTFLNITLFDNTIAPVTSYYRYYMKPQ